MRRYTLDEVRTLLNRKWFGNIVEKHTSDKVFFFRLKQPFFSDGYSGRRVFNRISILGWKPFKIGDSMNRSGVDHDLLIHFRVPYFEARQGFRESMRKNKVNIFARELTLFFLMLFEVLPKKIQNKLKKL